MILVTGGAGLVGKELIAQLVAGGQKIRAIYNKTPLPDFHSGSVEQVHCNILDTAGLEEAMSGVELVYHCAAVVNFNPTMKAAMFSVNIDGTANIINAALDAGIQKLVHVSSVAALGRIREDAIVDETMSWTEETSNSAYGQSKYLAEMEVWRGIGEGLNAVIVNPVIILGPGNWDTGSSKIFQNIYHEFPWFTDGITGFVDVRDVANAMIRLMNSDIINERFILSEGNHTYKELFDLVARSFNKKPPYKKVTPMLAKIVWRWESLKSRFTGKQPLVTRETAKTALAKVNFDNSKLFRFLPGFKYRPQEDTVDYTCRAFLNQ